MRALLISLIIYFTYYIRNVSRDSIQQTAHTQSLAYNVQSFLHRPCSSYDSSVAIKRKVKGRIYCLACSRPVFDSRINCYTKRRRSLVLRRLGLQNFHFAYYKIPLIRFVLPFLPWGCLLSIRAAKDGVLCASPVASDMETTTDGPVFTEIVFCVMKPQSQVRNSYFVTII